MKREVRFKVMPDRNIRAYQANSDDKAGVPEWMITSPGNPSATITTTNTGKIYLTIEK